MKKLYKITLVLLVLCMSTAAFGQYELLYVNSPNKIGDSILIEYLTLQGYNVTFVTNTDFKVTGGPYSDAATYSDFDAIYIGEALGSNDVYNFHAAGYPIPCVLTEGWCFKTNASKWNWLDDEANQFLQFGGADIEPEITNTIVFSGDEETWLGRQYEAGYELVWTTRVSRTDGCGGVALDEVVPDAIVIGNLNHELLENKPIFWAIPAGTMVTTDPNMTLGDPVDYEMPNMVYLGVISAGQDSASVEYCELIVNCIRWVTSDYEDDTSVDQKSTKVKVYPNPTGGEVNVSFASNVTGNVNVNVYNLAGTLVKSINRSAFVSNLSFDLSGLSNGQYLYSITTENEILRGKICKK